MEQAIDKRFVIIGCKDADKEAIARPTITYGQDAWRRRSEEHTSELQSQR